jgi:hypothetical protein
MRSSGAIVAVLIVVGVVLGQEWSKGSAEESHVHFLPAVIQTRPVPADLRHWFINQVVGVPEYKLNPLYWIHVPEEGERFVVTNVINMSYPVLCVDEGDGWRTLFTGSGAYAGLAIPVAPGSVMRLSAFGQCEEPHPGNIVNNPNWALSGYIAR